MIYRIIDRQEDDYGALVEWDWQGRTEMFGHKPDPVPLWPP